MCMSSPLRLRSPNQKSMVPSGPPKFLDRPGQVARKRGYPEDRVHEEIERKQAGELGFEPSFHASTSHGDDTGLTLENLVLQVFTIHSAPVYIIAALG